jgi:hypothetical protein
MKSTWGCPPLASEPPPLARQDAEAAASGHHANADGGYIGHPTTANAPAGFLSARPAHNADIAVSRESLRDVTGFAFQKDLEDNFVGKNAAYVLTH